MKARILTLAFVAVTSLASGCYWCHSSCCHPCLGWRLHNWCHPCAPVCSSPVPSVGPVVGPVVGPGCGGCCDGGGPTITQPAGYPPVIGQPIPLPGPTVVPSSVLPNPMPVPKNGNGN